jgi:protein MpaA
VTQRTAVALATVATLTTAAFVSVLPSAVAAATAVNARKTIGHSVKHRPIVAYHLGNPGAKTTAVLLGQMHGDEHAGVTLAKSIIDGKVSVEGINLWVIPTMNPDGDAAHTRQNAHHVDLNRNWPDHWVQLTGQYYSGPRPLSEPETKAMYAFLQKVHPRYLVSLHQPLHGVDTTDGGAIDHAFRARLARNLSLPLKPFRCWSSCHGSMTAWYTRRHGIGETIEFGAHPSRSYLTGKARTGIVAALGGHFGRLSAHNPRTALAATTRVGTVRLTGWAYDIDAAPGAAVHYTARRDGTAIRTAGAWSPDPAVNKRYHLTGAHGYGFDATARPGRHTFCLTFVNLGAGTANPQRCVTVTVPAPAAARAPALLPAVSMPA